MRFGILSPVVVRQPGQSAPWEAAAGPEQLGRIAETADRLGYHHLSCSEHIAVPTEAARARGGTYWDPLTTLGYLAARTRRIRLATNVLVLGYHHPLALAKSYGTLDRLSGGRVVLGVGVGTLEEEFQLLGAPFAGRGERADDALRALRAAWATRTAEYAGTHYRFHDFVVDPHAVQSRLPIWVGGRTPRSLRRACRLGDGWVPFGLPLARIAELLWAADPPPGFEVVLQPAAPPARRSRRHPGAGGARPRRRRDRHQRPVRPAQPQPVARPDGGAARTLPPGRLDPGRRVNHDEEPRCPIRTA